MKIKVCGLTREDDIRLACKLGAWAIGLVLAEGSPRHLSLERAAALRKSIPKKVLAVGVFEDATGPEVQAAVAACGLDAVQLHGAWPSFFEECSAQIWRGLGLSRGRVAPAISTRARAVVVEPARTLADRRAGKKPTAEQQAWAWAQAKTLRREDLLIIAAGGLTPGNVAAAIAASGCDAVDVSGGVESAPGVKDPAKLRAFFSAAGISVT